MVGFVLSHSLKRYLKETAAALELEHLPIRDFEEFRTDLSNRFRLTQRFKRKKSDYSAYRTRIAWIKAIDAAMARASADQLRSTITKIPGVSAAIKQAVLKLADDLALADPASNVFYLNGLAGRILSAVADAEIRDREAALREQFRRNSVGFDRAIRRLQQEVERKTASPLGRRIIEAITVPHLILPAIQHQDFPRFVRQTFDNPEDRKVIDELDRAVMSFRALITETDSEGRRSATDADLVILIALAAMIANDLDDQLGQTDGLSHLYQIRRNTAVFIDEVQDFTEVEIFLMGMSALSTYDRVTLSGDRCQRLQAEGAVQYPGSLSFRSTRTAK